MVGDVLSKIGRNVVLFQKLEGMLKSPRGRRATRDRLLKSRDSMTST